MMIINIEISFFLLSEIWKFTNYGWTHSTIHVISKKHYLWNSHLLSLSMYIFIILNKYLQNSDLLVRFKYMYTKFININYIVYIIYIHKIYRNNKLYARFAHMNERSLEDSALYLNDKKRISNNNNFYYLLI